MSLELGAIDEALVRRERQNAKIECDPGARFTENHRVLFECSLSLSAPPETLRLNVKRFS
jgi:hypothetical protein